MIPETIARLIKLPLKRWPGNCYGVATAIAKAGLIEGNVVYGHWTGPIYPKSIFAPRRHVGFVHHAWIVQRGGQVCDPTRYVFEAKEPYIYYGEQPRILCSEFQRSEDRNGREDPFDYECAFCGHAEDEHDEDHGCAFCSWPYDEGGQIMRSRMRSPPPKYLPKEPGRIDTKGMPSQVKAHILDLLGAPTRRLISKRQGQ